MAKVKSGGYTDTPINGVSSLTFSRGLLNFEKDFRVKSNKPGSEVVLTNLTCPVDRPEKIRIGYTDIANVYAGSGVDPSVTAPTKRGIQFLAQLTEVISVTDDTDPDYRIDLPVTYHIVGKIPATDLLTAADVQNGVGRLLSSLFDTGSTSTSRLEAILRGALVPAGL